jgi:hypothetical protein
MPMDLQHCIKDPDAANTIGICLDDDIDDAG